MNKKLSYGIIKNIKNMNNKNFYYCIDCHQFFDEHNFNKYKDNSIDCICKDCLTQNVDDNDKETFLWLCKRYDIPYIPEEWEILKEQQVNKVITQQLKYTSVFNKYLSHMKLPAYRTMGYKDSLHFQNCNCDFDFDLKLAEEFHEKFKKIIKELINE